LDRVYNYYDSNLRDTSRVAFDENNSYDSGSGSEASIESRRGQRRIIEAEDDQNTDEETSNSNRFKDSILMNPRRKMISHMEANSLETDEFYLDFASNGSNESSTSRLIEPFHQDLNSNRQRNTRHHSKLLQERRDGATTPTPTTTIMNQYSSEEESGATTPKKWRLSRMRRRIHKRKRKDT